jgi:hypothetical protein
MRKAVLAEGPFAVVARRKMCPGVDGVEGQCQGHDAIKVLSCAAFPVPASPALHLAHFLLVIV